jgi:hypothetical protein
MSLTDRDCSEIVYTIIRSKPSSKIIALIMDRLEERAPPPWQEEIQSIPRDLQAHLVVKELGDLLTRRGCIPRVLSMHDILDCLEISL